MQKVLSAGITVLLSFLMLSCGKENLSPGTAASLTIINGVKGSAPLVSNFSGTSPITYYSANMIYYGAFSINNNRYNGYSGTQPLALYQYPDTTSKSTPLYNLMLDLPAASINTLFLTGTADSPDTLFTRDVLPYYTDQDSSMGIRLVNLSYGSNPVSVNIAGKTNGSEVAGLSYKSLTGFTKYAAGPYVFEFRDAGTGALIASYTTNNTWLYNNNTLALIGVPGGTGTDAQQVLMIPYTAQ